MSPARLLGLANALVCSVAVALCAAAPHPSSYGIQEVVITVTNDLGDGERSSAILRGDGTGESSFTVAIPTDGDDEVTLSSNTAALAISRDEFVGLLKKFYEAGFFTMTDEYCAASAILVDSAGRVRVISANFVNADGMHGITVTIGSLSKSVSWCSVPMTWAQQQLSELEAAVLEVARTAPRMPSNSVLQPTGAGAPAAEH